jgi:sterol 24-C-methyltransferase
MIRMIDAISRAIHAPPPCKVASQTGHASRNLCLMSAVSSTLYQVTTRLRALYSLFNLSPEALDAYLRAYMLFERDWSTYDDGRREEYLVDYYKVINILCALGNVEKMYMPPLLDPDAGLRGNQDLFEQRMARDIGARPGARVLDVGCGRGRIANDLVARSGVHVTGLNIDPTQLASARAFAERNGLADRSEWVEGSMNDPLPFPDASFDAAYQVQAFTYAKDKEKVLTEIFRVMRPGAKFSSLLWVLTDRYDPDNPKHVDLINRARPVLGCLYSVTIDQINRASENAGFEILTSGNPSIGGNEAAVISGESAYYARLKKIVTLGTKIRILPPHLRTLIERLMKGDEAYVEAAQTFLASACHEIVCQKPVEGN